MFTVDQQPVKTRGRRYFGGIGISHAKPASMQNLTRGKAVL
jgi:hypothetical protein